MFRNQQKIPSSSHSKYLCSRFEEDVYMNVNTSPSAILILNTPKNLQSGGDSLKRGGPLIRDHQKHSNDKIYVMCTTN